MDIIIKNKFAVREAEREAEIANLELMLKDPTLTIEQENRANAQLTIKEREKEEETQNKADTTTIMNWAVALSDNPLIAQQLMAMAQEDKPNLEQAFALYAENKPTKVTDLKTQVVEVGGRKLLVNTQTGATKWWLRYPGYITSMEYSDNGQYLAAGSGTNRVYLLNYDGSQFLRNWKVDNKVESVAISEDGQYIVAGTSLFHYMMLGESNMERDNGSVTDPLTNDPGPEHIDFDNFSFY